MVTASGFGFAHQAGATVAPSITVTPSTNLVGGQTVNVVVHGLLPGAFDGIAECETNHPDPRYYGCRSGVTAIPDANGDFSTQLTMDDQIRGFCQYVGCSVFLLSNGRSYSVLASAPLTFAEVGGSPVRGNISLSPSTFGGTTGSIVTDGTNWASNAIQEVAQCSNNPTTVNDCDIQHSAQLRTDATGAFTTTVQVNTPATTPNNPSLDCGLAPGNCTITVFDVRDFAGTKRSAPLTAIPAWIGTVSLNPAVVDPAQPVVVSLQGWQPNSFVDLQQCNATDCSSISTVPIDGSGKYATDPNNPLWISRQPTFGASCQLPTDCRLRAVVATDGLYTNFIEIPLPFVALTMTVTPSTNLVDGQTITVNGSGFAAQESISAYECTPSFECAPSGQYYGSTDANGATSFTVDVTNTWLDSSNATIDCAITACGFYIQSGQNTSQSVPLTFASAQPVVSQYTTAELSAVHGAALHLGVSDAEYQHVASWAVAYIFGIANVTTTGPVSNTGPGTIATTYASTEYNYLDAEAQHVQLSFAQYQKLSALAVAYILG